MGSDSDEYYTLGLISKDLQILMEAFRICAEDARSASKQKPMLSALRVLHTSMNDMETSSLPSRSPVNSKHFVSTRSASTSRGDGTIEPFYNSSGPIGESRVTSNSYDTSQGMPRIGDWHLIAVPTTYDVASASLLVSPIGNYLEKNGCMGFACALSVSALVGMWFIAPMMEADSGRKLLRGSTLVFLCHMFANIIAVFFAAHRCNRDLLRVSMTYFESLILCSSLILSRILWVMPYAKLDDYTGSYFLFDTAVFLTSLPLCFFLSAPDCLLFSRRIKMLMHVVAFTLCVFFLWHGRCVNPAWDAPIGCAFMSSVGVSRRELFMFGCAHSLIYFAKQVMKSCFNSHFTVLQPRYVTKHNAYLESVCETCSGMILVSVPSKEVKLLRKILNDAVLAKCVRKELSEEIVGAVGRESTVRSDSSDVDICCLESLLSNSSGLEILKAVLQNIMLAFEMEYTFSRTCMEQGGIDLFNACSDSMFRLYSVPRKLKVSRRTVLSSRLGFHLERTGYMRFAILCGVAVLVVVYSLQYIFARNAAWYTAHGLSQALFILLALHRFNLDIFFKTALSFDAIVLSFVITVKQVVGAYTERLKNTSRPPLPLTIFWDLGNWSLFLLAFCVDAARLERKLKQFVYSVFVAVLLYVYCQVRCVEEAWNEGEDVKCSFDGLFSDASFRDAYASTFVIMCVYTAGNFLAFASRHEYAIIRPQYIPESILARHNSPMRRNGENSLTVQCMETVSPSEYEDGTTNHDGRMEEPSSTPECISESIISCQQSPLHGDCDSILAGECVETSLNKHEEGSRNHDNFMGELSFTLDSLVEEQSFTLDSLYNDFSPSELRMEDDNVQSYSARKVSL